MQNLQNCGGKKRPLQAVIFDMDGLMFDTERILKGVWDTVGEEMGYGALGHHIYHTLGMNPQSRQEYFEKTLGTDFPYEEFLERYRAENSRILSTRGAPVKKGLYELLDYLREKGCPMVVATSASEHHAESRLTEAGVMVYFKGMLFGNRVQFSKPHPQIYQLACKLAEAEPENCIALEDSVNGLRAAIAAGMMAVMVPDLIKDAPEIESQLAAKLADLSQVRAWIDQNFEISDNGENKKE